MRYITVLCEMHQNYAEDKDNMYWLRNETNCRGIGFALLEENWRGSYDLIKFRKLDSMIKLSEYFDSRDELEG